MALAVTDEDVQTLERLLSGLEAASAEVESAVGEVRTGSAEAQTRLWRALDRLDEIASQIRATLGREGSNADDSR